MFQRDLLISVQKQTIALTSLLGPFIMDPLMSSNYSQVSLSLELEPSQHLSHSY